MTNNKDRKDSLSNKYTYIITYNSTIDRSDRISLNGYSQAAADSIIEMYLLSKCDIIVKTLYSSFGNTSQLIGGYFWLIAFSYIILINDNFFWYSFHYLLFSLSLFVVVFSYKIIILFFTTGSILLLIYQYKLLWEWYHKVIYLSSNLIMEILFVSIRKRNQ